VPARGLGAALLAAIVVLAAVGGCDWFDPPAEPNVTPDTTIEDGPCGRGTVYADQDIAVEWSGDDPDGQVVRYEWTYDDTLSGETTDTTFTIEDVAEGDHFFRVAAVDDDGDVDPTPAICDFTAEVVGRAVLVEFLTASWCTNCPNGEEALLDLIEEYGPANLTVVAYHWDDGPVPPDPVATDESNARATWYIESGDVDYSFPWAIFDGGTESAVNGADSPEEAAVFYRIQIEARRAIEPRIAIELTGEIGARGGVSARVQVLETLSGGPNVLWIVVIEDEVPEDDPPFEFVSREIFDEGALTISEIGESTVVDREFDIDPSWNAGNMDVIAFVQNETTREILQSTRLGHR
jgi:thiol-disulfide isomerase/thioredoxin